MVTPAAFTRRSNERADSPRTVAIIGPTAAGPPLCARSTPGPPRLQGWAQIDAEIQPHPGAAGRTTGMGNTSENRDPNDRPGGRTRKTRGIVFRGSAPEEPPRAIVPSLKPPLPSAPPAAQQAQPGPVQWQVRETPSFRILHLDPELAERAAEAAEAARDIHIRRWTGSAPKGPWSPKCDVYLYPTAMIFSQMTGQPEESPGFSAHGNEQRPGHRPAGQPPRRSPQLAPCDPAARDHPRGARRPLPP